MLKPRSAATVPATATPRHQTANYGLALPNDGFANLALDSKEQEPFDRSASATGNLYGTPGLPDSRDQSVNRHGWNPSYGLGREKVTNASYNLELPLQDDLKFYSFSTASYMETTKVTGNYRPNDIYSLAGDPNTPYPDGIHAQRRNRTERLPGRRRLQGPGGRLGLRHQLHLGRRRFHTQREQHAEPVMGSHQPDLVQPGLADLRSMDQQPRPQSRLRHWPEPSTANCIRL